MSTTAAMLRVEQRILVIRGLEGDDRRRSGGTLRGADQSAQSGCQRNAERFPADFMFQLTSEEKAEVVTNCDHLARLKFFQGAAFRLHGTRGHPGLQHSLLPQAVEMACGARCVRLREVLAPWNWPPNSDVLEQKTELLSLRYDTLGCYGGDR